MVEKIKLFIDLVVLNWGFVFGILFTLAVLSKYIFGPDNLFEELIELANKMITGQDIDISPDSPEDPSKDLNMIFRH